MPVIDPVKLLFPIAEEIKELQRSIEHHEDDSQSRSDFSGFCKPKTTPINRKRRD